jgi:hypothetical protein
MRYVRHVGVLTRATEFTSLGERGIQDNADLGGVSSVGEECPGVGNCIPPKPGSSSHGVSAERFHPHCMLNSAVSTR